MQFHSIVLQLDGRITDRRRQRSQELKGRKPSRRVVCDFKRLLRENLGDKPIQSGTFTACLDKDQRLRLQWQQADPLSALATFTVNGKGAAVCLFLYGFEPMFDEAAVKATEDLLARMLGNMPLNPSSGLRRIRERPAVIAIPWESGLTPKDSKLIGNFAACLAAVFFDRAESAIKQVEEFWKAMGLKKTMSETDHLWN